MSQTSRPIWAYILLGFPGRIQNTLRQIHQVDSLPSPNLWQVTLGAMRMLHRLIFRSETIGTCSDSPVRQTWRAKILKLRPLRIPCLIYERAIAPLDLTGLASSRERIIRHLIAAHHDGRQFNYDLELLQIWPGALEVLLQRVNDVVDESHPKSRWFKDLAVFDGYHESLQTAVQDAVNNGVLLAPSDRHDPDTSLLGFLNWCASQPTTPKATLVVIKRGQFTFGQANNERR
jgi:hypothetical protein